MGLYRKLTFALVLLAAILAGGTAFAKPDADRGRGDERGWQFQGERGVERHDPFGRELERHADNRRQKPGEMPLSQIVKRIQQSQGGQAEQIQYDDGRYVILWRYPDGKLVRLVADARTGKVRRER